MLHSLRGPNGFTLGLFAVNADGGLTLTRAAERWPARWPEILQVVQIADQAGLDFVLPIARWKGFGGATNSREWSFETFTFAAALAGATRSIGLFATVHVPMVHPVFAAKALATLDHASGGRAGLNIVCGWNPQEFGLFGLAQLEDRYAQGQEWAEIVARILAGETFDFSGRYYRLRGVSGQPGSVQTPRPVTVNAAFSPAGRDFAARHADFLLTTFVDLNGARTTLADMTHRATSAGRTVGALATAHVVCRPSLAEAEAYYHRYAVTLEDTAAVDRHMSDKQAHSGSHDPATYRLHRKRFAGGAGTFPLIGTPASIVEQLLQMSAIGYRGVALSFVNFKDELPYFIASVLPMLRDAGLREG